MTNEHIGMILSLCGMIITVLSFQIKGKKPLLAVQSVGNIFFLVSYIFSGGGIAVWLNCIFLVRNFLYMNIDGCDKKIRYTVCGALCAACVAVYVSFAVFSAQPAGDFLWNLLPMVGALFGTVAVVNVNVNRLRMFKLGDSLSWLAYNARIGLGALGGILGEVFNIISIVIALLRYSENRNK